MSGMLGILWRIRDLLSQSMKQMFYNAYILPSLDYALIVWSDLSDGDLNRILLLQKRAVRVVTNSKWDAPSKPLFRRLGWMTIKQRVEYQRSVLVYLFSSVYLVWLLTILVTYFNILNQVINMHYAL